MLQLPKSNLTSKWSNTNLIRICCAGTICERHGPHVGLVHVQSICITVPNRWNIDTFQRTAPCKVTGSSSLKYKWQPVSSSQHTFTNFTRLSAHPTNMVRRRDTHSKLLIPGRCWLGSGPLVPSRCARANVGCERAHHDTIRPIYCRSQCANVWLAFCPNIPCLIKTHSRTNSCWPVNDDFCTLQTHRNMF